MNDAIMGFAVFGSFVLIVGQVTRMLSNISLNRTLREALRSHPQSVPLLAARLDAREPWADALLGWIFVAFAGGLALMSLFESAEDRQEILKAAIVPLTIGIIVLGFVHWAKTNVRSEGVRQRPSAPPVAPAPPPAPSAPRPPRRPRTTRQTGT